MHASVCCLGNCPVLFLCSWQCLWWPINNFSAVDKVGLARMAAGSHSSTSLTSWFSALNCSYLLQVWLSSQTGAVSSLKESPAAAFTGAHILSSLNVGISIWFWKISWVTWKQMLFLILTGDEPVYTYLSRVICLDICPAQAFTEVWILPCRSAPTHGSLVLLPREHK